MTLIDGDVSESDIETAARLVARYSQGRDSERVEVEFTSREGKTRIFSVKPLQPHEFPREWLI